ncbi:hypothetical protein BDR26DRAFT_857544 [Obelidium mucronatum]|nr:hypothetical protein BDR26DRAFT_857544 [Obelidium mucronatum]
MVALTATISYLDAQCATPIRIEYSHLNATDCVPSKSAEACVAMSGLPGWYSTSACTSDPMQYGNGIFKSSLSQVVSLSANGACSVEPTSGSHYPFGTCIQTFQTTRRDGYLYNSFKVAEDVAAGTMNWIAFTDNKCQQFAGFEPYGSVHAPNCISSGSNVTVLNYKGIQLRTLYTGSDCKTKGVLWYASALTDCKPLPCAQNAASQGVTEYFAVSCTSVYDLPTKTEETFATRPHALKHFYYDSFCQVPNAYFSFCFGYCYLSSYLLPGTVSLNSSMDLDGQAEVFSAFTVPGCQGTPVVTQILRFDGTCNAQTRIYNVSRGINSTIEGNPTAQSINTGVLAGSISGGLVFVLILVALAFWWKKRQNSAEKKENNSTAEPESREAWLVAGEQALDTVQPSSAETSSFVESVVVPPDSTTSKIHIKKSAWEVTPPLFHELNQTASSWSPKDKLHAQRLPLPADPTKWSVEDVCEWAVQYEADATILQYIKDQEINGRALMLLSIDDFSFSTVGRRVVFEDALTNLKIATISTPPSYGL